MNSLRFVDVRNEATNEANEKRIEERARAVVENCIERRNGNDSKTCPHICSTSNLEVLQRNTFVFFSMALNNFSAFLVFLFTSWLHFAQYNCSFSN